MFLWTPWPRPGSFMRTHSKWLWEEAQCFPGTPLATGFLSRSFIKCQVTRQTDWPCKVLFPIGLSLLVFDLNSHSCSSAILRGSGLSDKHRQSGFGSLFASLPKDLGEQELHTREMERRKERKRNNWNMLPGKYISAYFRVASNPVRFNNILLKHVWVLAKNCSFYRMKFASMWEREKENLCSRENTGFSRMEKAEREMCSRGPQAWRSKTFIIS